MITFTLPDLGEGLQEAEIVSWHVTAGDRVIADQPLVAVETEKAVVEIPAPHGGVIAKLRAEPGAVVPIGAPLVDFEETGAPDAGAVVGILPADEAKSTPSASPRPAPASSRSRKAASVRATPAVRRRARELGVEIAGLRGGGPDGAITLRDVEAARTGISFEGGEPLRGVRRVMAKAMTRAHAAVVPATVTEEADITAWPADAEPTLRLIRAITAGRDAEPALNAWFDGARGVRRLHETVDLGLAVDAPDGLFVPVLRAVDPQDIGKLRDAVAGAIAGVTDRSLPPEAFRGATITLSNFGMLGGLHASLVVTPPQVAILGAGRIVARASDQGRTLPLSLSFDHRAVNGGEAARFITAVKQDLERPD